MTRSKSNQNTPNYFPNETLHAILFHLGWNPEDFLMLNRRGLLDAIAGEGKHLEQKGEKRNWKQITADALREKAASDRRYTNLQKKSGFIGLIVHDNESISKLVSAMDDFAKKGAQRFIEVNSHSDDTIICVFKNTRVSENTANKIYEHESMMSF